MDKKINDIGELSGKILVFGGVYSNLQALQSLQELAEDLDISPENCICTGDIVGYCSQPEETIQFFRSWGAQTIAGNVEIQLANDEEDCGCDFREGSRCDDFSKEWYPFAKMMLSKESVNRMKNIPEHIQFRYAGKKVFVVHGSFFNTSEFIFKSTSWDKNSKISIIRKVISSWRGIAVCHFQILKTKNFGSILGLSGCRPTTAQTRPGMRSWMIAPVI